MVICGEEGEGQEEEQVFRGVGYGYVGGMG